MKNFLIALLASVNLILGFGLVTAVVEEPTASAQGLGDRTQSDYLLVPVNGPAGSLLVVIESRKRMMLLGEFKGQAMVWYDPADISKQFTEFP